MLAVDFLAQAFLMFYCIFKDYVKHYGILLFMNEFF